MPEGHVTHRLARDLTADFAGRPVRVSSPQGRFGAEASLLDGHACREAEAVGKHLFVRFADLPEPYVHIHLGLIGKLRVGPAGSRLFDTDDESTLRLRLAADGRVAELRGPQWCRLVSGEVRDRVLAESGPDPLRADADPARAWARIGRSRRPIGALLMDQRITAGVGNIFRAEVLFRQRMSPFREGQRVTRPAFGRIWADLVGLMEDAVTTGRIDSVLPEHEPEAMGRAPRLDRHGGEVYVYRRAGQECLVCGREVSTAVLQGRNLYWCRHCQRR
ncbi:Fpg/Nei family DNA glycosylase [Propionicicella superfundia]|uniref:Fpg/Nei family DNA glycosylase n=1 Tax=Propionicicella superfundia TaxID=348582 RepID=UPI0003F73E44|nr:DNA-formamidopyrimidine glycosylase family protein [Propionicicella superfundia]